MFDNKNEFTVMGVACFFMGLCMKELEGSIMGVLIILICAIWRKLDARDSSIIDNQNVSDNEIEDDVN